MKKSILSIILIISIIVSLLPINVLADDVTVVTWDDESGDTSQGTESVENVPQTEAQMSSTMKPFLALGANLSNDQMQKVLTLMGLAGQDLSQYEIVYITNEMEHQYLDKYVDSKVIGTKALSSVLVKQAPEGHGVQVTTQNINFCTVGMYRNALLTAGVKNADILVVGPTSISGTAALIGALKAYERMSGQMVSEAELDTALDELVTTGNLVDSVGNADQISDLIAYVKAKVAGTALNTKEEIENAIRDALKEYGAKLSDSEIANIVDLMMKIKDLGLDYDTLLDQAQDLYNKFGDKIDLNGLSEMAKDGSLLDSVGKFFSSILQTIVNFFSGLFGK